MTKQEVIRKAYGDYYVVLKTAKAIDQEGWIDSDIISPKTIGYEWSAIDFENNLGCIWWRVKSLRGLETNNGWVKILSDKDLPTDPSRHYKLIVSGFKDVKIGFFDKGFLSDKFNWLYKNSEGQIFGYEGVTHWKVIIEDLLPLY